MWSIESVYLPCGSSRILTPWSSATRSGSYSRSRIRNRASLSVRLCPKAVFGSPSDVMTCCTPTARGIAHGLDDLHRAEAPRRGRIEQVGVRAPGGDLQPAVLEHALDVKRVGVQARDRREAVLDAHAAAVRAIGDVGILETPVPDAVELVLQDGEWIDQRETTDFDGHRSAPFRLSGETRSG